MLIKKVVLDPFGGFSGCEYSLKPGLNVVLGDNEAGKTTLVNAVHAALFIPFHVKKNSADWKNLISTYFPYPHGDTARVILEFARREEEACCRLHCAWGAGKETRLILESGEEVTEPSRVREKVEEILRHGRGTCEAVLMARQEEMVSTLEKVRQEKKTLGTLADMLREVVFQSGGVSVDELEEKILKRQKELESNWDFERNAPRDNRDIDSPHKKNVGDILDKYYQAARLERQLQEARNAEARLEGAVQRLQEIEEEYRVVEQKEEQMGKIEADIQRRNSLEPKLEACKRKQSDLLQLVKDWPKKQAEMENLEKEYKEKKKDQERLEEELEVAEKEASLKKKREIYRKARDFKNKMQEKHQELKKLPPVNAGKLEELEGKEKELSGLRAELGGMKLKLVFNSSRSLELKVIPGLEEGVTRTVEGETSFEADGRMEIQAGEWSLRVQSGEKDVDSLLSRARQLEKEIEEELRELGVSGMDEARKVRRQAGSLEEEIRGLESRHADALEGHTFEELEKELQAAGEEKQVRSPEHIRQELGRVETVLDNNSRQHKSLNDQLEEWEKEYGGQEKILEDMAEAKSEGKKMEEELQKLAPLPGDYHDSISFLQELKEVRERKENLRKELYQCREEKIKIESEMPEESPEELEKTLQEIRRSLDSLKEEARALRVVQEEFTRLKEELDADTFQPVRQSFEEYLYPVTGYRYRSASMDGAVPEEIISDKGEKTLPVNLLSHGTISGVALALRLSLARHLLQDADGFLMMDDPLVDLDPNRKKQAAEILNRAAEEVQIIITTFDPNTAELLDGHVLRV